MESSTTYNIKFELFKISEADYNAQVEADNTPQFDRIGEKKLAYNIDRSLGELLISNYGGNNIASFVDQFLTDYKYQHFLSCSRDCYLVTNKYNGSNEKIERRDEDTAWKTPVLLPITNLSGNSNSASIVSYRSTISQAKPYSNWVNNDSQNDENDNIKIANPLDSICDFKFPLAKNMLWIMHKFDHEDYNKYIGSNNENSLSIGNRSIDSSNIF